MIFVYIELKKLYTILLERIINKNIIQKELTHSCIFNK